MDNNLQVLYERLSNEHFKRLNALANNRLNAFLADAITLTNPDSVYICTDDKADMDYIRQLAVQTGEERPLAVEGHTVHFDGYYDQARDKKATRYLLPEGKANPAGLYGVPRSQGLAELRGLFKDVMVGKQMLVCFWTLGPTHSEFAIPCVQITDSPYVAHSEAVLYRPGYEHFKRLGDSPMFFSFLHSAGEQENGISRNYDKRRIYIDREENIVYSVNTQYAGNTVGLKKLALRLAIHEADYDHNWLAEHMFIMGVHGPKGRVTYFCGAFPSGCGKTSTAMLKGHTIIGDDLAYFRKKGGQVRAVNVEKGIFGIIENVNPQDDPIIFDVLSRPGEVIFSNVLVGDDGHPYWTGMGGKIPEEGVNFAGRWREGDRDPQGNLIPPSHRNARYTIAISSLANRDPRADDPEGVPVGGIIYGGRDSDTWVPVEQAFDWTEGIIGKGASLESETTAATLGKQGVRTFNLMSMLDFLSIPMGKYIQDNLDFVADLDQPPLVFSVNYFLKNREGRYLNGMQDKRVWLQWMELRVNGDVDAVQTPTGYIPRYEDLARLFKQLLHKDYTRTQYVEQFTIRIPELLAKIDRIEAIYQEDPSIPRVVFDVFSRQRERLQSARIRYGDYISPFALEKAVFQPELLVIS